MDYYINPNGTKQPFSVLQKYCIIPYNFEAKEALLGEILESYPIIQIEKSFIMACRFLHLDVAEKIWNYDPSIITNIGDKKIFQAWNRHSRDITFLEWLLDKGISPLEHLERFQFTEGTEISQWILYYSFNLPAVKILNNKFGVHSSIIKEMATYVLLKGDIEYTKLLTANYDLTMLDTHQIYESLFYARCGNELDIFIFMHKYCDINISDIYWFCMACRNNNIEIINYLVENNRFGRRRYHHANYCGYIINIDPEETPNNWTLHDWNGINIASQNDSIQDLVDNTTFIVHKSARS
jgi:hypothetical protein